MLVKAGTNFAGYYALDNGGSPGTWVQVGSTVGISAMNTNLLSGLAGTSHNNGVLCTAVYDNVSGNSNRNVTLTPVANQSGIATINLSVSDGWFTAANTFNLVVPTTGSDTPPAISNLTNSVSIIENGTATIPFTVGDAQSAPSSLLATGFSSNPNLIPNANLGFGGSNSNRTLTLTPVPDQTGTATISVVVNDGTLSTTNTVALTVLSYKPPVIGNLPASVTMMENSTNTVSFTVSDAQVAVSSLTVSGFSSNPALVANANLGFGGSGSNLTVTLIPSFYQIGSNTISLVVSDGVLNATNSFLLTVAPPTNYFTAVASGDINDPATWGGKVAVKGDTNVWQTGGYQIDMTLTNVDTFYGKTFVLQTGGKFFPNIANAVLTLNNLVLAGGIIICGNNGGLNLDLSGQTLTLDSGTVQSGGGTVGGRDVILGDGSLAGSGTIDITGSAGNGFYVQFQSSINPTNFTGVFSVNDNGTLYLPAIALTNASFGLNLTYPGQYQNLANVALASLVINGANLPPGSYAYTNFTASEQSFLVKSNGTITVVTVIPTVPVLAPIDDVQTLIAGQTLSLTNVATDLDYPPPTLTFSLLGSPDGLNGVPAGMVINPTNGILTWRPTIAQSLLDTMTVGVQVSNNGNPPLLAQQYFDISVVTPVNPSLTNVSLSSRRISFTITGDSGPDYVLLVSSNLTTWLPVWTNSAAMPPLPYSDAITNATRRFYQVLLGP